MFRRGSFGIGKIGIEEDKRGKPLETTFGYIGAVLMGIILGMIGGGGSILAVPLLVYLMDIEPVLATGYSLFIVGITALIGAFRMYGKGCLDIRTGIVFTVPAFIAVFAARKFLIPWLPDPIFFTETFTLPKDTGIMIFFALIMLFSAVSMIRSPDLGKKEKEHPRHKRVNIPVVVLEGTVVGLVTGLVGAGGGFLIVPALVILGKLPMKLAVGTSLMVISAKSLIGFVGDVVEQDIEWGFLVAFTLLAVFGILIGEKVSEQVAGENLKKGFGWFVMIMGAGIVYKELIVQ